MDQKSLSYGWRFNWANLKLARQTYNARPGRYTASHLFVQVSMAGTGGAEAGAAADPVGGLLPGAVARDIQDLILPRGTLAATGRACQAFVRREPVSGCVWEGGKNGCRTIDRLNG